MTLNQGPTEFMLAMGLEDKMVGTASMDDTIWPRYAEAPNTRGLLVDTLVAVLTMTVLLLWLYSYYGCTADGVPLTEYLQAYNNIPILAAS